MEDSILTSTKKIVGIADDYTAFDLDILTHIGSTFTIVSQLGIGPSEGITVEDAEKKWSDLELSPRTLNLLRTYVFLRVRMLFDPPSTSFLIDAINRQITEHEQRLSMERESTIPLPTPPERNTEDFYFYYDEVIETL